MLKKSTTNRPSPLIAEASPRGKGIPGNPATASEKTGGKQPSGVVAQVEAKPSKASSTFTAPRKECSGDAFDCGFTRPGKM